jgi:hypothetical protein
MRLISTFNSAGFMYYGESNSSLRRMSAALLAACGLVLLLLLHYFSPARLHLPPCSFHALTGFYCPGCGAARALHHLLRGELSAALRCNLPFVLLLPVFIFQAARLFAGISGYGSIPAARFSPAAVRALALAICLWMVIRNLPFACFHIPD